MHKYFYKPTQVNSVIFAVVGSPWGLLALWVVLASVVTFFTFGLDKWKAKRDGARRIPEKTLFWMAALGGSIGALLGMKVWHHKTLHRSFKYGIPAILIGQILLVLGIFVYFNFIR